MSRRAVLSVEEHLQATPTTYTQKGLISYVRLHTLICRFLPFTSTPHPTHMSSEEVIGQLEQAKTLALTDKATYPQVLRQILNIVENANVVVQRWISQFLRDSFVIDESKLSTADKIDLAIDSLAVLTYLSNVADLEVFKHTIDAAVPVFRLVFRFVADNDGLQDAWGKLQALKTSLVTKFTTTFPFPESFNDEENLLKNVDSKVELIKFLVVVIDYQLRSASSLKSFSLTKVNPNHTLVKPHLEAEAAVILDVLLAVLKNDILVPPVVTAVLNHVSFIAKAKPQFLGKILSVLETFESNNKLQSNMESLGSFKLARKYVDRTLRVLINHLLRLQVVPPNFQNAMNKKLQLLVSRGDDIRKKNIVGEMPDDSRIKKRKFEGFQNPSTKLLKLDYKSLYCLTDPSSELGSFDVSTLPAQILVSMTLEALKRASVPRLKKGLEIIGERYAGALRELPSQPAQKVKGEDDDDDDDDKGQSYNPETVYSLPPPKTLSFKEKKAHVNLIIKNFFRLAEQKAVDVSEDPKEGAEASEVSRELTKIAIKSWKKDSWLILLTRLATRGMRNMDSDLASPDAQSNEELSDLIRNAIFEYVLANIHGRIDMIIEWLNEEWYSEKVFNEDALQKDISEKITKEYENDPNATDGLQQKIEAAVEAAEAETPVYNKWAGKLMDSVIAFLEPKDRKIFLRLLSDLPYLNESMVSPIKSLCQDPERNKIGFLALQYLIMYRPPVKGFCMGILRELSEGDQEDLKSEATKLLEKYDVKA